MEWIATLWLPVLASSVAVFFAASIIHMLLPHHRSDWRGLPDEGAIGEALRNAGPGRYMLPWCGSMGEMGSPEMLEKYEKGPVGFLTVIAPGRPTMGKKLLFTWLLYLVVSFFVGYLAHFTVVEGASFSRVFQVTGVAAVLAYTTALVPHAIWYERGLPAVKDVLDGLAYGLVTAAVFGLLWPVAG